MRIMSLMLGLTLISIMPSSAQNGPASPSAAQTVTVLSDALAEPDSDASQIFRDLSILLDRQGDLRAFIIDDYGGASNVRDLLQLRGVDFAIVNSDVLASLSLSKTLPDARRKIRLVAPLASQRVLLFAKRGIEKPVDLNGKKVATYAARSSRGLTAKTIFGLLKIDAKIQELEEKELSGKAADMDAVLVFDKDLPRLRQWGIVPATYHLLALPASGPLAQVYFPAKLAKSPIDGFPVSQDSETLQVATVLAAFDWNAGHGRYPASSSFVAKFFALLPELRRKPRSPLRQIDVRADLPGWQRLESAVALASAAPAPVSGVLDGDTLRVLAVARPPFTNPQQKDGGVVLKLFTDALANTKVPVTVQWATDERTLIEGMAGERTADAGVFIQSTECESPGDQSPVEASICDRASLSEPLMQAVLGVFTRIDTQLDPNAPGGGQPRTICIPESQPVTATALNSVAWIKVSEVRTLRPKTLIDCVAAVDGGDADGMIGIEPETRFVIDRLKLGQVLQLSQRIDLPTGIHVAVAKENPRSAAILQAVNEAIGKLRANGGYAAVMSAHLADLTGTPPSRP